MKNTIMLKKNYEFKNVLSKGKRYSAEYITAYILKNNIYSNKKLGLAIGVKTGKAYQRNRIKRLLREEYKKYENKIVDNVIIVFILNKNIDIQKILYSNIEKDMKKILETAGVCRDI